MSLIRHQFHKPRYSNCYTLHALTLEAHAACKIVNHVSFCFLHIHPFFNVCFKYTFFFLISNVCFEYSTTSLNYLRPFKYFLNKSSMMLKCFALQHFKIRCNDLMFFFQTSIFIDLKAYTSTLPDSCLG